jgi:hypothetical protein
MQNSRAGRQTVSKGVVRHRVSTLMSIALVIALAVIPSPRVGAQVECLGACEAQFAACVGHSGGHYSMLCQDTYEICVNSCLGSFAALLG